MKFLDKIIQLWRIRMIKPYVPEGGRVLDIGCDDGILFKCINIHLELGIGIDPGLSESIGFSNYKLIKASFPEATLGESDFDVIVMLAVLEHFPMKDINQVALSCISILKPGGFVLITIPSPLVDLIVEGLIFVRLVDGMNFEKHNCLNHKDAINIFTSIGFRVVRAKKFQLGLNNLYVLQKPFDSNL